MKLYFVLLMKSHLQSYPCPLQINSFWNLGFLLGITIILQIITGIFLGLHYTSDLNSAYSSLFFFIREMLYGWCLRYLHSRFLVHIIITLLFNGISYRIIFLWFHPFLDSFSIILSSFILISSFSSLSYSNLEWKVDHNVLTLLHATRLLARTLLSLEWRS
jgi:ubiquinol-cytochrome c reductase cytochrome b subunit